MKCHCGDFQASHSTSTSGLLCSLDFSLLSLLHYTRVVHRLRESHLCPPFTRTHGINKLSKPFPSASICLWKALFASLPRPASAVLAEMRIMRVASFSLSTISIPERLALARALARRRLICCCNPGILRMQIQRHRGSPTFNQHYIRRPA